MFLLIKYEFKKLAKSKVNAIAMLLGLALLTTNILTMGISFGMDKDGSFLYGKEAGRAAAESAKLFEGSVSNEDISNLITEYQKKFQVSDVSKYGDFRDSSHPGFDFAMKNKAGTDFIFAFLFMDGKDMLQIDLDSNPDFYQMYRDGYKAEYLDKIDCWIPLDKTEKEMNYWIEKTNQIKEIRFGNVFALRSIFEIIPSIMMVSMVIVIMVSMTYIREYRCKTDAILLTTKHGKNKLVHAKNIAAFLYFTAYFVFCVIWICAIETGRYGYWELNTSVQVLFPNCVFDITVFQAIAIMFTAAYSVAFAIYAFTVFVSARMKSILPVCGIALAVEIAANFFVTSFSHGNLLNHLVCLTPYNFILLGMIRPISFDILGMVFNVYQAGITVYMLLGFVLLFFAGKGFKVRHE